MKKLIPVILCLVLLVCLPGTRAAAETDLTQYAIANGVVRASAFDDITAPCSGTLLPFDWEAGDTVDAGTAMFEMMTTNICAPEDGTVRYLFAEQGDSADSAMATYGAVLALEPSARQRMHCTYEDAADYEENKHLHIGDVLYFKSSSEKGSGVVIAAAGDNYEVEILTGSFDADKKMDLYKDSGYRSHDKVGKGKVYLRDDVTVAAAGRIAEILVAQGDEVTKGDVLLRVMAQDADAGVQAAVSAPADGVVGMVAVSTGQQVWKGQLLCRVWRSGTTEVVAEVDEMDLGNQSVGDQSPVTMDTDESRVLTGTVTEISALGNTKQNAAYYNVHLSVNDTGLMLGQSASVYLP